MFYLGLLFVAGIIWILVLGRKDGRRHHTPQQDPLDDLLDQIADDTDFLFPPDRTPEEQRSDAELMLLMMMEEDLEEEKRGL